MTHDRQQHLASLVQKMNIEGIDLALLNQALIHPSYAMEQQTAGDNQRLEFLGDAVIDLLMGEYLYRTFPNDDEGKLTKMRASLVCEEALAEASMRLGLSEYLLLGRGEAATGGASRPSNLADAWEAVCGAIYLSAGIDALKPMVLEYLDHSITLVKGGYYGDYKTRLQEYIQREPDHEISYELLEEVGPAHDRRFHMQVCVDDKVCGQGWGKSKKAAQREAALAALISFGELPPMDAQQ